MLVVLPTELSEKLTGLDLQIVRQRGGEDEHLLELDAGISLAVELVDDVGEALEVGVHGAVECEFGIGNAETAHFRIVVAHLERGHLRFTRPSEIRQSDEAHVHIRAGRANWRRRLRLGGSGLASGTTRTVEPRLHFTKGNGQGIQSALLPARHGILLLGESRGAEREGDRDKGRGTRSYFHMLDITPG